MWQKSRAIWKYIDFHYNVEGEADFDWFVLGGDDIFLIVENLRKVGGDVYEHRTSIQYSSTLQQRRLYKNQDCVSSFSVL